VNNSTRDSYRVYAKIGRSVRKPAKRSHFKKLYGKNRRNVCSTEVPVSFSNKQSAPTATSQVMCFKCNEMGHYANHCKKRERTTENAARQNVNVATENNILFNDSNLKFFKDAKINGKQLRSYVDLGSQVCALRDDCSAQLRLNCNWANTKEIMEYGGAVTTTLGDVDVDLEIDCVVAKVKLQIVPKKSQEVPLLVGHPFTEQGHIQVHNQNR
jgi:hypothetical protein